MAGYSVTYTVVDQATAQIDKINKRIQQLRAPLDAQAKVMAKFVDVSGLRRLEAGLGKIASTAMSAASSLGRMVPALGAITSATTIAGIGKLVTDFSNMATELTKTGLLLDETPEKLSGVSQAMRSIGGNGQTAIDALIELKNTAYQAAIGLNGTAAYTFQLLNVAILDHNKNLRDVIDVEGDFFKALDQVPNMLDRQTYALKAGGQALLDTYLQIKAMGLPTEEFMKRQREMQTLDAQRTRALRDMSLAMGGLNAAFYDLGATIAGVVAPVLTPMLNDLAKWVTAHKDDIAGAIKGIADALVWFGNNLDTVKTAAEIVGGVFVTLWGVRAVSSVLTLIGQVTALNTALGVTSGLVTGIVAGLGAAAGAYKLQRDIREGKPELPGGATDYSKWLDLGFLGHKLYNAVTGNSDTSQEGKTVPIPPAPPGAAASPVPAARPSPAAGPALPLPKGTREDPLYVVPINGGIGGSGGGGVGGASYGGSGYGGGGGDSSGAGGGGAGGGRPAGRFGGMAPGAGVPSPGAGLNAPVQDYGGKIDRSQFAKELQDNPALREKILRIAANEQGSNPAGVQSVLESMMNRAQVMGTSLAAQAKWHESEGGYYAQGNMGRGALEDPKHRAILETALTNTLNNSNISNFATDNASAWLADKRIRNQEMLLKSSAGGESFFAPGGANAVSGAGVVKRYGDWFKSVTAGLGGAPSPAAAPSTGGKQNAPPQSTEQVLANPQNSRGYPFPNLSGKGALPPLPPNTTNYTGMEGAPDWVKQKVAERQAQRLNAAGQPLTIAQNGGGVKGGVDINVTHSNPPAGVGVTAASYGTGLNLAAPRVEHQQFGQI